QSRFISLFVLLIMPFVAHADSSLNKPHDSSILDYIDCKLYIDIDRVEFTDIGMFLITDQDEALRILQLHHDDLGYFLIATPPRSHRQKPNSPFLIEEQDEYSDFEGCPPFKRQCEHCLAACNWNWAEQCFYCGNNLK
ncbi:MAG: hypothetical protein KAR79_05810, partial [Simkaniaceae bacterium]|nr:hypothetical protein [Simkaniaceae bacterium]